jgi:ribonucleoside-diphosphate reductase alpha chain
MNIGVKKVNSSILKLLKERYFLKDEENWEQLVERVSGIYPDIKQDLLNKNFIFSSPTLMHANSPINKKGTLSSCFPMQIEDSITGIFQALQECAEVSRSGGGVGYNFSSLRSSKEMISSVNGYSCGPLPFLNIFNSALDAVRQGGKRRSAGMALCEIDHPNILDFIEAKQIEGAFSYFNFSVMIPDTFYKKLEITPNAPHIVKNKTNKEEFELKDQNGNIVTVKQLWDKIIDLSWKSAEPGIFNSDIAFKRCSVTNVSKDVICNPCLPEFVDLLTPDGLKKLKDIQVGDKIWSKEGWTKVLKKWSTGIQKVYEYKINDYFKLYCTEDHKVVSEGKKIEAKNAIKMDVFGSNLVFYQDDKLNYKNFINKNTLSFLIKNSKFYSTEEVFDITVDNKSHTFWCNHFNISNCSEFVGIPYQSCNLGSINLANLVEKGKFQWDKFEKLTVKGVRALNAVLDQNFYPLDKIEKITLKTRPIGLGYMGLASALLKMKIPYNSKEALNFVKEMNYYLTLRGMQESIELAKEYKQYQLEKDSKYQFIANQGSIGGYEKFDYDLFIKANERFFTQKKCRNIDINQLLEDLKQYGIRNSSITSIAPTGTISTIAGVSGGVEPIFALSYARKITNQDKDVFYINDPIFDEYLTQNFDDKTKEKILKEVSENKGSCQKCKDIPEEMKKVFITAGDLTPKEHLDMLEIAANYTSLSVSKTINMPENISKDLISEVFLDAHKRGIIGVTCYREGSREGVLVYKDQNKNKFSFTHAPKRPYKLPCEVHRVTVKGKQWVVFIGILEGKPFEAFAGEISNVNLPKTITKGIIVKEKSRVYSFEYEGEYLIRDICKVFYNNEHDDFARLVSFGLRHSGASPYIVETLNKSAGDVTCFSKAIARTLKKYIPDGTHLGNVCPVCGEKIVYNEGCQACISCGYSKC